MKKLTIKDYVLILICAAIFIIFSISFIIRKNSSTSTDALVRVYIDSNVYAEYKLSDEVCVDITTQYGTNHIVIKDNKVYVSDATCPDKVCVKHAKIYRADEQIICIPNHLVVRILQEES